MWERAGGMISDESRARLGLLAAILTALSGLATLTLGLVGDRWQWLLLIGALCSFASAGIWLQQRRIWLQQSQIVKHGRRHSPSR
jgi:hypothetical protein